MYKIQTLNKIDAKGIDQMDRDQYEVASEFQNPDTILVRSAEMHGMTFPASLKAIARAGAGVNNIPIPQCTENGIVVFNTPGANANAVKELVIGSLFLAARNIPNSIEWIKGLVGKGDEVPMLVEKGKANFVGPEIMGKKLAVVGLGAIGVMVANAAQALGMEVIGFDPFISVEAAWGLSKEVRRAKSLDAMISEADYITIHIPLAENTKNLFNASKFAIMKKGVRFLNFSRNGLVNNADMKKAIEDGIVTCYITDFADEDLLKTPGIICLPHLGASTPEAEENCAIMAVRQVMDFLERGNIKNSVNFPDCEMDFMAKYRLIIANKNIPNMVGQITTVLAEQKINISDMINKHRGDIAYNIIDVESKIDCLDKVKAIDGIIMARIIEKK
jgi:D-3-phosphoglycerate dehydrogenase